MDRLADLIEQVQLYKGELLPGFYDEWIILCREQLNAAYHQKMRLLLDRLENARNGTTCCTGASTGSRSGRCPSRHSGD
jgi:hypothetical protein